MPGIALMHQLSAQRGSYYFFIPIFLVRKLRHSPGSRGWWSGLTHWGHVTSEAACPSPGLTMDTGLHTCLFSPWKKGLSLFMTTPPPCWEHKRRYLITAYEVDLGRGIKEQPEWGAGEWIIMRWRKDFRASARPGGNQATTACEAQVGLVVSHPPS